MAQTSDFDPSKLRRGMVTDAGDLKPSLVTGAYTGGVPSVGDLRPGLALPDGTLRAGLVDSAGDLKPSLLLEELVILGPDSTTAYKFNGTTSKLDTGELFNETVTTFGGWIRTDGEDLGAVIGSRNGNTGLQIWQRAEATDTQWHFISTDTVFDSVGSYTPNKWHFVAFTVNGTELKIYIDGTLDSTHTIAAPATTTRNFEYGKDVGTGYGKADYYLHRVYDRILTAAELESWKNGNPPADHSISIDDQAGMTATAVTSYELGNSGELRSAPHFDGVNDYVSADAAHMAAFNTAWEVTFNVEATDDQAGDGARLISWGDSSAAAPLLGLSAGTVDNKKLKMYLRDDANVTQLEAESTADVLDGLPHTVSLKNDGAGTLTITVDGVSQAETYTATAVTFNRFSIGALGRISDSHFAKGHIWEVKIYSDDTQTTLVNHWPLDEGSGTVANDAAGSANGTVTNATGPFWSNVL